MISITIVFFLSPVLPFTYFPSTTSCVCCHLLVIKKTVCHLLWFTLISLLFFPKRSLKVSYFPPCLSFPLLCFSVSLCSNSLPLFVSIVFLSYCLLNCHIPPPISFSSGVQNSLQISLPAYISLIPCPILPHFPLSFLTFSSKSLLIPSSLRVHCFIFSPLFPVLLVLPNTLTSLHKSLCCLTCFSWNNLTIL